MIKLLIRADDLGYSEAVNYGIEKVVKYGLVKSVGLMPNMPAAAHGVALLGDLKLCMGQHTNVCLGKPCSDPQYIPSLLNEQGNFWSSKIYREAYRKNEEFTNLDEMIIEIEAQYQRFLELVGEKPKYFEGHAIMNNNFFKALKIVADRYNLKHSPMTPQDSFSHFNGKKIACCSMDCMNQDYDAFQSLKNGILNAEKEIPNIYVCHPGYIDEFLLKNSSLTLNRAKEVEMLSDPLVYVWIKEQNVELISYDDI